MNAAMLGNGVAGSPSGGSGQDNTMMLMMLMSAIAKGDTTSMYSMVKNHLVITAMTQINKVNLPSVLEKAFSNVSQFVMDNFPPLRKVNLAELAPAEEHVHVRTMVREWNINAPTKSPCHVAEAVVWYIMEFFPEHIVLAKYVKGVRIPTKVTPIKIKKDHIEIEMEVVEAQGSQTITATVTVKCTNGTDMLNAFVKRCMDVYDESQRDKFDGRLYIIDMVEKKRRNSSYYSDTYVGYDARPFESTRRLDHVFLEPRVRSDLLTMVDRFEKDVDFYKQRGVPHRLGIMLHGPPGTGKTSTIKALAMSCRRHPFIVRLSQVQDADHLRSIFMNPTITLTINGGDAQTVCIPISRRLYILEDVDGAGCDALLDRKLLQERAYEEMMQAYKKRKLQWEAKKAERDAAAAAVKGDSEQDPKDSSDDESENAEDRDEDDHCRQQQIQNGKKRKAPETYDDVEQPPKRAAIVPRSTSTFTLADFLNVMDGIDEVPGRMIIMTSNHPETLDPAVLRPGRIDIMLKLGNMCKESISDMLDCYFPGGAAGGDRALPDRVLTPCQVANAAACSLSRTEAERRVCELASSVMERSNMETSSKESFNM